MARRTYESDGLIIKTAEDVDELVSDKRQAGGPLTLKRDDDNADIRSGSPMRFATNKVSPMRVSKTSHSARATRRYRYRRRHLRQPQPAVR